MKYSKIILLTNKKGFNSKTQLHLKYLFQTQIRCTHT